MLVKATPLFAVAPTTLDLAAPRRELIAEAFNLIDHPGRAEFDGNQQSPSFGQATQVATSFPPRQIQIGARLEF